MRLRRLFHLLLFSVLLYCLVAPTAAAIGPASKSLESSDRTSPASDLEGEWVGRMDSPSGSFEIRLELVREGEEWGGGLVLPDGMEAPVSRVDIEDDSLRLVASEGAFVIEARAEQNSIEGVLSISGNALDVLLVRADTPEADALKAEIQQEREALRARSLEPTDTGPAWDRIDSNALERLLEEADATHSTALAIRQDSELVGEWYLDGEPRTLESMSLTKTVLNLAIGRLVALGRLDSLDTPVHEFYPEWDSGKRAEITLRHLLTHTSGLEPGRPATPIYESEDFVAHALSVPLVEEPGAEMQYNNNAANLLADIASQAAGEPLDEFLEDDLFAHLGITEFGWSRDPAGNPHGMAGLQIRAGDLARLGQLALDEGEWEGEQLIDPEWFEMSFRPGTAASEEVGLLWFLLRDEDRDGKVIGAMHSGHLGQWLVLYPEERLVGVRMVEQSPAYNPETDAFPEFRQLLRNLMPPQQGNEEP